MSEEERQPILPESEESAAQEPRSEAADTGPTAFFVDEPPAEPVAEVPVEAENEGATSAAEAGAADSLTAETTEPEALDVTPLLPAPNASVAPEVSGDDTLLAALAWLTMVIFQVPVLSVILLLIEPNRSRPFQRYHAVASIAFWCVAVIYETVVGFAVGMLTLLTLGIFALCMICLWVIFIVPHIIALVYAFQALTGKTPEIPVITKLARDQRWI